eukprot:s3841_g4.t1
MSPGLSFCSWRSSMLQCSLEKHPGPATMRRRESGPGSVPCQSRQHSRRSTAKPSLNTGAGKVGVRSGRSRCGSFGMMTDNAFPSTV